MSESVEEVVAPARVDPVPLLHWVRRRSAAMFEVVAVLPDDSEHDVRVMLHDKITPLRW